MHTVGIRNGPLYHMVHDRHGLLTGSLWQTEVKMNYSGTVTADVLSQAAPRLRPSGLWGDGESRPAAWQQTGLPCPQTQHLLSGCPCRFSDSSLSHLNSLC